MTTDSAAGPAARDNAAPQATAGAAAARGDAPRPAIRYALDGTEPPAGWEMFTPEMAHDALAHMRRNRPLRNQRVEAIKRDILRGKWRKNGETVKQGKDGLWDDGQHRFTAIYRAAVAVPMLVVRGIDHDDAFTVDAGIGRNYRDRLTIAGLPAANVVSSIVRRMWYWDERRLFMQTTRDIMPTDSELETYRLKHEDEIRRSLAVAEHAKECWLTATTLGTVAILLRRCDEDAANIFLRQLITGAELKITDPAYALRRRLQQEAQSEMRNYETRRAMVMIAWNKYRDGEEMERLLLPRGSVITNRNYPLPY
jgi:hypothetical protein